jgi:hypothetical protein
MRDFRFSWRQVLSLESSGKLRRVVKLMLTDVSGVRTASIIRVMNRLITLMMEAVRTSETSAYFNECTGCFVPEDSKLQQGQ